MLRNYLKVLWRNITRHKLYSAINIIGLTAGMSFAMTIGVFTWKEMQVNQELEGVDRLYMVEAKYKNNDEFAFFVPAPLLTTVADKYPDVIEHIYRFVDRNITVSQGDQHLRLQSMIGDSTFLQTFGFKVIDGSPEKSLNRPNTIVITEKVAQQFFGRTNVAGETLIVHGEGNGNFIFEITAVISTPLRKNTATDFMNMDAQVFLPMLNSPISNYSSGDLDNWNVGSIAFVRLTESVDRAKATALIDKIRLAAPENIRDTQTYSLNPVSENYLTANGGAVKKLLMSLSVIVAFILLLAISNFVNITISGSFSRLKEIGVRKVIGGLKQQVILQFLSESVTFSLIAGVLSLVIYEGGRTWAGMMLNAEMPSVTTFGPALVSMIVAAVVLIGLLAGAYPAWYLSRSHTLESLKGKLRSVKGTLNFSRALVAVQFTISIFIFTGALIISEQIRYFIDMDLGYDEQAVMVVTSAPRLWSDEGFQKMESAKREMLQSPAIKGMSLSTGSPSGQFSMGGRDIWKSGTSKEQGANVVLTGTDEDFLSVYSMQMKEGKYFTENGEIIPNALVINEKAQKLLKVELGDRLRLDNAGDTEFPIVGIVKDFNTETLHSDVLPVVIMHTREFLTFRHYSIKINAVNLRESVAEVERAWHKVFPGEAFQWMFADDRISMMYKTEYQMNRAANLAAVLMMIIVMTGVLGLVALSVARRTKEIGIRKVLGASANSILSLISREYLFIMLIAFAAGLPLSYWFVADWLNTFVYHIDLNIWSFALPVVVLSFFTLLMVVMQASRAALSNPVNSIKQD